MESGAVQTARMKARSEWRRAWGRRLLRLFTASPTLADISAQRATVRLALWNTALMVAGVSWAALLDWRIGWCFREGRPMTWASFFQLILVAAIAREIWIAVDHSRSELCRGGAKLWRLMWWGFLFLACDELLKIHETVDHRICDLFNLDSSGSADHIDDVIVGLYGLAGAAILLRYWREALRLRAAPWYFGLAAAATVATVGIDLLGGSKELLSVYFPTPVALHNALSVLDIAEEACKIYGEVFFVGAFARVLETVRRSGDCGQTRPGPGALLRTGLGRAA
jgi:hypothetical protein